MNWRDNIINEIKNRTGLIILTDPNQIISNDDTVLKQIADYGFEILLFSDSISMRYFIENKKQDTKNDFNLIILYGKNQNSAETEIPFDILQECNSNKGIISFSLYDIFPKLSISIVEKLDPKYYDKLFEQCKTVYEKKNDDETKDFLLEQIFGISSKTFSTNSKIIIRDLIDLHLSGNTIPQILRDYLVSKIKNPDFVNWPLNEMIANSKKFFDFLQKEWEKTVIAKKIISIPFDNPSIFNQLDNLFLIGKLKQVETEIDVSLKWMSVGIANYDKKIHKKQLEEYLNALEIELSKLDRFSHHLQWQNFSLNWANLCSKCYSLNSLELLKSIQDQINDKFTLWVETKYKSLRNAISDSPIMVHHIFNYLIKQKQNSKIALIVMDGMSLSQWFLIKQIMNQLKPQIKDNTNSIFAWIPTITSISRQSIFSGFEPYYLKDSLLTSKEENYWKIKWIDAGKLRKDQIFYKTNIKVWNENEYLEIPLNSDVIGLVINTIDDKMHSVKGGMVDLFGQINDWAKNSAFFDFIEKLLKNDFQIFITSDHGNIEAIGIGEPKSDFADERGRRVRIYSNEESMNNSHQKIDSKIWWPKMAGLNHHFLLPLKNNAFSSKDELVVTHGADSFEEVMVPFVKLWWEE